MIGTDRGVTDSRVAGNGGGARLCVCVSVSLSVCVCVRMATDGNVYHLPPLFLALTEKNQ